MFIGPLKLYNKRIRLKKKTINLNKSFLKSLLCVIKAGFLTATNAVNVNVMEVLIINRRSQVIILLWRFRG